MIRSADVAMVVWNGEPAAGLGGTQEFVEEAVRKKIPVAIINPAQNSDVEHKGNWERWPQAEPNPKP